jgi:hypothetical protein
MKARFRLALAAAVVGVLPRLLPAQVAAESTLAVAELRADFDTLRRALEEAHGGFDRWASRAEVGRRLDAHRARLDRPMRRLEFAGVLAEAIAELRDGHARLELDSVSVAALADARVLPLRVAFEGDRLLVMASDAPGDSTIRPGMELVRIDGREVRTLVAALASKVPRDGFVETGRRERLAREFAQYLWLYGGRGDVYRVQARDASGRLVSATLSGILERERPRSANLIPPANVTLDLREDSTVGVLRVRAFGGARFPALLDSAFGVLRERRTGALVLDLRGNGGGVDEYGALLLSYLTDRPFRYFDRIRLTTIAPSFATWLPRTFESTRAGTTPNPSGDGFLVTAALHPGVAEQRPASRPFLGRLVVLIDGGSFSTTADVAAQLRSWGRATFVGEETGGTYEGNTSGLNALVVLPHSRLRLKVMMYGYWNAVRAPDVRGRGTRPDHAVAPRVSELLRGGDPVLARALELLRRR